MTIVVSGAAGFIGSHVVKSLLEREDKVIGIDNINDYYSKKLKLDRLKELSKYKNFIFKKIDISKKGLLEASLKGINVKSFCHLAAQAGVRYSLDNPRAYILSNINAYLEVLEFCRNQSINKLVYASSSSVYGGNSKIPFSVSDRADNPLSIYAATKKSNELMSQAYLNLFSIPMIGLRFFTVYGPWGRPDMAIWKFTEAIFKKKPIKIYNNGKMERDFTYIDDIVKGIISSIDYKFHINEKSKHKIFNLGNNNPIKIMKMIKILEKNIGLEAKKEYLPMQPGDVKKTYANIDESTKELKFLPEITIEEGIKRFIVWFRSYHGI